MCVCVRACVCLCVRACVRACVCVCMCVSQVQYNLPQLLPAHCLNLYYICIAANAICEVILYPACQWTLNCSGYEYLTIISGGGGNVRCDLVHYSILPPPLPLLPIQQLKKTPGIVSAVDCELDRKVLLLKELGFTRDQLGKCTDVLLYLGIEDGTCIWALGSTPYLGIGKHTICGHCSLHLHVHPLLPYMG